MLTWQIPVTLLLGFLNFFEWLKHDNTHLTNTERCNKGTAQPFDFSLSRKFKTTLSTFRTCKRELNMSNIHYSLNQTEKQEREKVCLLPDTHWLCVIKGRATGCHWLYDWVGRRRGEGDGRRRELRPLCRLGTPDCGPIRERTKNHKVFGNMECLGCLDLTTVAH